MNPIGRTLVAVTGKGVARRLKLRDSLLSENDLCGWTYLFTSGWNWAAYPTDLSVNHDPSRMFDSGQRLVGPSVAVPPGLELREAGAGVAGSQPGGSCFLLLQPVL